MRLQFLGAARTVTGSCFLLETASKKILIDCGMFQGSKSVRALNYRDFSFEPPSVDCVLLTHAHADHCGLIPKLCKQGFKGTVYATKVTCELAEIMLPDSAHIQEYDAEVANRKGQRAGRNPVEPLYTVDDAYRALTQFSPVPYDADLFLGPEISARYRDAGHIIGSAILEIFVKEGGKETKLVFSGDLGQPNQPIIKDPTIIGGADYVIVESTYGNRLHQHCDKEDELAEIVNDTVSRGGNVIIPSFAVGRTQTMLYYLHKLWREERIPNIPVIIDSPLAIAATRIFAKNTQEYDDESLAMLNQDGTLPQMPHLSVSETAAESKAINSMEGPLIIISASGMADAGRILHHLKHNLWRPESSVLFVGYQAAESMGRRLIDGIKRVKIMGEEVGVKAKIYNMDGFSAHADRNQLLEWLSHIDGPGPTQVFLVHGESPAACSLGEAIEEKFSVKTYIPYYGDSVHIDGRRFTIDESTMMVDPAVKDLEEYLSLAESDYRQMRKRLISIVAKEPKKLKEAAGKVEKALKYLKKLANDL